MGPLLLSLVLPAQAADHDVIVQIPAEASVDPGWYDELLEDAAGSAPIGTTRVRLIGQTPEGRRLPLAERLPESAPLAEKDEVRRSFPTDNPGAWPGFLQGKGVYLSQCHGFIWYTSLGRFSTQRGILWETVEDFHNPEGMNQYLARYLENAGAGVFMARERDMNPDMAIADNDGAGYAEVGSGFAAHGEGFRDAAPYNYGDNPFRKGTVRKFPNQAGNLARWTPDVPSDGEYAVYVSWKSDAANAANALYRIRHPGGTIERRFDQRVHGSTWQYVETLWLTAGSSLTVELVGETGGSGQLSADAVRIGGGMGDVRRNGVTTQEPRWSEGSILYAQFNGAPSSVYDPSSNGDGTDPTVRSRWAAWEHPAGEDAVYLSWHSNAANGNARGTVTYTTERSNKVAGSDQLASLVQDELIDTIRLNWESGWQDRGTAVADFAEVNPNHNPEMPSILVELAFHDNETDNAYLKQPGFRQDSARAMYRGVVRYFAQKDGRTPVFLPEPPEFVGLRHDAQGRLELSWQAGAVGAPFGDVPTGYVVFTSKDGRSWDNGREVTGLKTVVEAAVGEAVYARVAAKNAGGISFPSEIVGARRAGSGKAPVLVVNAFDRLDSGLLVPTTTRIGAVKRMNLLQMNASDGAVAHGQAIDAAGWPFETVSDEVFDALDLGRTRLVVWVAGEESTADESFTRAQQTKLQGFVQGGGALWATGAEILWDLDARGNADDKAFASAVLGATLESDDAGTNLASGFGLLDGVRPLDFGLEEGGAYPVEWPDVLASSRAVIARYGNAKTAGVLGERVSLWGFPFETIADPLAREEVAIKLLPALVPDYDPATDEGGGDTDDTGGDTDDSGADTDDSGEDTEGPGGRRRRDELGCGCASGAAAGGLPIGLLALVLGLRRRAR